jgi:lysozyme
MTAKILLALNLDEFLRLGSQGIQVAQLQEILRSLGLDPGPIDGIFGIQTLTAVKLFQQQHNLQSDGIVGSLTQDALNASLQPQPTGSVVPVNSLYGGLSGKLPLPGVALIKEFEGCSLTAYPDPCTNNQYNIGWGSTHKADGSPWSLGDTITQKQADDLLILQLDVDDLPTLAKIPVWDDLNANQQGALLSFGYNLGANFYGHPNFTSITRVLQNKQWDQITATFVKYRNPGSSVEEGLKQRRLAEAKLFLTPIN